MVGPDPARSAGLQSTTLFQLMGYNLEHSGQHSRASELQVLEDLFIYLFIYLLK